MVDLPYSVKVWVSRVKLMGADVTISGYGDVRLDISKFNGGVLEPPEGVDVLVHASGNFTGVVLNHTIRLGKDCFSNCECLLSAEVNCDVKSGVAAFADCVNLQRLGLNEHMPRIPELTFQGCISLQEVQGVSSVQSIGKSAFDECTSLSKFDFGEKLKQLGESAFQESGLVEADLSKCLDLGFISDRLFAHSRELKRVVLPEQITHIGSNAFRCCYALSSVELGGKLERIGDYAFAYCKSLRYFHTSSPRIGTCAFLDSGLETLELDEGVEQLDSHFLQGTSVKELRLPSTIYYIDDRAFDNSSVKRVLVPKGRYDYLGEELKNRGLDVEYYTFTK